MAVRQSNQLWIIAGAAATAILILVTWFLAVSPQRVEAAEIEIQTQAARDQAQDLQNRITKLTAAKANLPALTTALDARKAALPTDSGVPAFLRQLQATGTKVGVDISGITVADPVQQDAATGVWELPIQLTAEGTVGKLGDFLEQLQGADQKRAVLVEAANLTTDSESDAASLSLTVKAFVAPPVGAGAPSITTN